MYITEKEIDATRGAIKKASDELKELELEQLLTISPFDNQNELQEKYDALYKEYLELPARQRKYNSEKQRSEDILLILRQQEIKNLPLYSKETESNSSVEFKDSMEQIWSIINDTHRKLTTAGLTNLIIKPFEDGNKLTKILDLLEGDSQALLDLKRKCNSNETEQHFSVKLAKTKKNLSAALQKIQESFFDRIEEAEKSSSVKLKEANEQLTNLVENRKDIEEQIPLLKQKIDEYDQLSIAIGRKEYEISELNKKEETLESKLNGIYNDINSLPNTVIVQPKRRNTPDESEESTLAENDERSKFNQIVVSIRRFKEQRQQLENEEHFSSINLIGDTQPSTITESNPIQQKSRKRKWVDSKDESLDQENAVPKDRSLREELEAADPSYREKRNIVVHDNAVVDLIIETASITETTPVVEIATTTVTETAPITEMATVTKPPVVEIAPTTVTEIAPVIEMDTVATQTDITTEQPVHAVVHQGAVSVYDNADVDPYENSFGLETLFAEEIPTAAEPKTPVDDPPATHTDIATKQLTPVVKQTNSETKQTNSETEQIDIVVIPSTQILAEEELYTPPINFDTENDIAKYITYIEFDYLNLISNALSIRNHILTHNFMVNVVAAGDNDYCIEKGGWIQFIKSITKQEQKGNILAFKNNQQGFIVGFDIQPFDKLIIGIAYALASSHTKLQTIFNDKQNTILHVAAIYTQYTLSPNIYLNSYLKYGKAFIKNKGKRNSIAINSKTKGYVTRVKLETYYKVDLDKFLFKPIVGIVFDGSVQKSV